jgi:hypothetical protein
MAAGVNLLQTRARWAGRLSVGSADIKSIDADAVHRDLRELGLRVVERLAQLRDPFGRGVWRRLEFTRWRSRTGRRVWTVETRWQSFEDTRNGNREVTIARRQSRLELDHLSAEILTIVVERCRSFGIERKGVHEPVVDPQRDFDRLRTNRTQSAQCRSNHIVAVNWHAIHRVKGVRQAQPGDVVAAGECLRIPHAAAIRSETGQRRLQDGRAEERRAGDLLGRRNVLFHQHR